MRMKGATAILEFFGLLSDNSEVERRKRKVFMGRGEKEFGANAPCKPVKAGANSIKSV